MGLVKRKMIDDDFSLSRFARCLSVAGRALDVSMLGGRANYSRE